MKYDLVHRRFNISWDSAQTGLIISIHRDCLKHAPIPNMGHEFIRTLAEKFGAKQFQGDLAKDHFGFDESIIKTGTPGNQVEFLARIPQVQKFHPEACTHCGGKGTGDNDIRCFRCYGTGKKRTSDSYPAYRLIASLSILLRTILEHCEYEVATEEIQLVRLSLQCEMGRDGSGVGGCFGIDLSDYLLEEPFELSEIIVPNVQGAMLDAHALLTGRAGKDDSFAIRCECDDGHLNFICPGDACCVHLSGNGRRKGEGVDFSSHNMDTPTQALTCLAGIASLVGQASFYISARKTKQSV